MKFVIYFLFLNRNFLYLGRCKQRIRFVQCRTGKEVLGICKSEERKGEEGRYLTRSGTGGVRVNCNRLSIPTKRKLHKSLLLYTCPFTV